MGEASGHFEPILLPKILNSNQKTVIQQKFADNSTASEIYRDLITNQLADTMSKSGAFGLAKTFEHQLTRPAAHSPSPPTTAGPVAAPRQGVVKNQSGHALCRPTAGPISTNPHE